MKVKIDHRSKFSNLSNWKEEAWKNQGFNRIRTRDLCDTGAMLYQLSYEATHWERGQICWVRISSEEWNDVKYIVDITRWREDMNFMFEWQEQYLTSERSERVRYCSCHESIKFISSRQRVMFFLLYGDYQFNKRKWRESWRHWTIRRSQR